MRRCGNGIVGYIFIILGVSILLALLLPAKCIVYLLTVILIVAGVLIVRSC